MGLLEEIKNNARKNKKRIVLPEALDERTIKAANIILSEGFADLTLIGSPEKIKENAQKWELNNIERAIIIDPLDHPKKDEYTKLLFEIRKNKGMTMEKASELVENPLYLGTLMIKNGDADGEVAGAENTTGNVLRPALQIVKTLPGISVVSGAFFLITDKKEFGDDGLLVVADCAVLPNPNAEQLAEIAIATAQTAENIASMEPRVAMLSFSTKGSAEHEMVDKVRKATEIAKAKAPHYKIDGELQADAAIVSSVGERKAPGSDVAGRANILIFPNVEVGNIAYKLVQRFGGAEAIGPILQGMAAPINDLSRGCSIEDIVNLVAITANQASQTK